MSKVAGCALCGLPLPSPPIRASVGGAEELFCCAGCAQVYQVAAEQGLLDVVLREPRRAAPANLAGFLARPGETAQFRLDGMWCAGCAVAAEHLLRHEAGVTDVAVSFAGERGRIQYDPARVDPERLLQKLNQLGYRARPIEDLSRLPAERRDQSILLQFLIAFAFSMQIMLLYIVQLYPMYATGQYGSHDVRNLQYLLWLLATPVLFVGGRSFLIGAWRALLARTATMDTLVALGTLSAYGYSAYMALTGKGQVYFDSVGMITSFVMLGRYLETMGGAEARKGVRRLLHLQPRRARRQSAARGWEDVAAADLAVDDVVLVRPGERVPADGPVLEGTAEADESVLTGESRPAAKAPGAKVYAGTLLVEGALVLRVAAPPARSQLARIANMVEETLAAKPRLQRLADRASGYLTAAILSAAILAAGWHLLSGQPPAQALLSAVAVLVVACPCALGLATPLALSIVIGRAAEAGVLVRNPAALETAAGISRVVFDKTGTLTRGQMAVVAACPESDSGLDEHGLLSLAAAVEQYSEHPLARAVRSACPEPPPASEFLVSRGLGAQARLAAGPLVKVGAARFAGVDEEDELVSEAERRAEQGQTVIWVAQDAQPLGYIAVRDAPNPTAKPALESLRRAGIRVTMLSGDEPKTAAAVAAELGMEEYAGHCAPEDKAGRIAAWQALGEKVAMVGDGVNDAPALAQSDLSVTAAGGTDVAGETSDAVLMRPDLTLFAWFLQQAQRARTVIIQNLVWAFAYNLVAVPLAALGIISPLVAAGTMSASSVLVVLNSLRLRGRAAP